MGVTTQEVGELIERVWGSFVGLDLEQPGGAAPAATAFNVTGCVQITGAWEGALTLQFTAGLARNAASIMFDMTSEETTFAEIKDAVGELTNMVGGNFKVLLPQPCNMSLPAVVEGKEYRFIVPGTELRESIDFQCDGQPLRVCVFERPQARHGG